AAPLRAFVIGPLATNGCLSGLVRRGHPLFAPRSLELSAHRPGVQVALRVLLLCQLHLRHLGGPREQDLEIRKANRHVVASLDYPDLPVMLPLLYLTIRVFAIGCSSSYNAM